MIEIVVPFPLIAAGEQTVPSLAAILIAAVPLIIAVLALRFDHDERATGARLVGLVVGFAGTDRRFAPDRWTRSVSPAGSRLGEGDVAGRR